MTETAKDTETPDASTDRPQGGEKVPEAAENMEHTLRRLTAEKEKRREKNPGLYL